MGRLTGRGPPDSSEAMAELGALEAWQLVFVALASVHSAQPLQPELYYPPPPPQKIHGVDSAVSGAPRR